ncbi:MAG: SusC/RagA family TonB-linked outer membrane protein [Bacteroidales bacterium]|nr:SusC/RagA family TonB-linked outer membrane protein [Bacteroidales bacterium]
MGKFYTSLKWTGLIMMLLVASVAFGQKRTITGKVMDGGVNEPLPGVNIIIKGTTTGAITDIDGQYSIQAETGNVLVFSFIGFNNAEKVVGAENIMHVTLEPENLTISEYVVIGYGTQKKTDKTGAVSSVRAEELNNGVLTDPVQALQGKTAGVSVTKKGGDPNGGFSVKIRGQSGFKSGTDPLYVVDGVPGVDPTTIAPEDIESFNILKDASSTAIYGARGANGVVLIETKRGRIKQANRVEINTYNSVDYVAKRLDFLTADQLRQYVTDNNLNFLDGGANTDWQDAIYRTGHSQSYNIAASGGDENTSYRMSLTHTDYSGVLINSDKTRTIGRLNLEQKALNNRLLITANLSATIEENNYIKYDGNGPKDVLYQTFSRNPTDPIYDSLGNYSQLNRDFQYNNPVALAELTQNDRSAKRILGNLKADYQFFEGLNAYVNLGYTRNDDESFYFEPTNLLATVSSGYGKRTYNNFESKVLEAVIKYDNTRGLHSYNLIGGYSFQEDMKDGLGAQGTEAFSNLLQSNNLGTLYNVNPRDIWSYKESNRLISGFARVLYNYDSRFFLTATIRRDGSSRFGDNHKWGWFPSGSVAWNIKKEKFLEDNTFFETLKIRVSYGLVGNQEIGNYRATRYAVPYGTGIDPETGSGAILFSVTHNENPNLKWEENSEFNIGIDFGILNNRLSGSLELYDKRTYDLLVDFHVDVPPYPFPLTWGNGGEINNRGIELNLQWFVIDHQDFDWKSTVSFSKNIQELVSLESSDGIFMWSEAEKYQGWLAGRGLVGESNWTIYLTPGHELGSFYMPEFAKISDDGAFLFYTAAGGITRDLASAERRWVGSALPDFEAGWSNFITYKNFDINVAIRAVIGGMIMNNTRMIFENPQVLPTYNVLTSTLDVIEDGLTSAPVISSYYLEDGSYMKIDNLSIGYTFDVSKINWLSKLRIYVVSNNLYTLTSYTGLDPEISYNGLDFGVDKFDTYPKTRTFAFGINATF